ncbi:MAG: hypothetical protein F6K26_47300, partial [Moorea sp. SIO2I5]|nr:hypothetical protein [Moorena sp. SIO2I5]
SEVPAPKSCSEVPVPKSLFRSPCSLLPAPCSLFQQLILLLSDYLGSALP